jgi:cell division protein FtsW
MTAFPRTDTSLLGRWWWTVDRWTLGAMLLIIALGIVLTMAASPAVAERIGLEAFHFARRQFAYLPIAVAVLVTSSLLSPRGVRRLGAIIFAAALVMTALTLVIGTEIKGATRWLHLGPLSLQPSEFLKPAFAVVGAALIAAARLHAGWRGYLASALLTALVVVVLLRQPDVGMTLMFIGTWGVQLFLIGLPLIVVGLAIILFVAAGVAAYFVFGHVRARVDHFLDPASGSSDGFQVSRALEAFRAGGLFGRGPGEGQVKSVLPDAHSDFILAVAGEEFGLILCLLLVALFAFVVLRGFARALKDEDLFVMLASAGLLAQFGMQALINMASTLHLIPPKGITLPFISYGGSATIALALSTGMVLALTRERPSSWQT